MPGFYQWTCTNKMLINVFWVRTWKIAVGLLVAVAKTAGAVKYMKESLAIILQYCQADSALVTQSVPVVRTSTAT
jgi:hypothetical protein